MNLGYFSNILQSTVCFYNIISMLTILLSSVSSTPLKTNRNSDASSNNNNCHTLGTINTVCSRWYLTARLPNIFGHDTLLKAQYELNSILNKIPNSPPDEVTSFLCVLYLPPCPTARHPSGSYRQSVPLPCRAMCDTATAKRSRNTNTNNNDTRSGAHSFRSWPVMCHNLPTQRCYEFERNTGVTYVKTSNSGTTKPSIRKDEIAKEASIESEIGGINNEGYDLEVVSLSTNQDHGRRYDITDLGDPAFFQGWADVQGTGSANDYCRVVGRPKRRFLSCHLSGNANQGHHYVSKLGFEMGYPGTWFMRDMDGDGKDDYCRCVGPSTNSKVTCMKAGDRGFFGSPMQAGSQHSFVLTSSTGCHGRRVNALFGE